MKAQQLNIDTISNNLANVNTTGFKKQRVEFKDLMYEQLQRSDLRNGVGRPVSIEVGHGVMPVSTTRSFGKGNFEQTYNNLDFAIDGPGFFAVLGPNNQTLYTRDGSFKFSVDGTESMLVSSDGYPVLDENDMEIFVDEGYSDFTISPMGMITAKNPEGEIEEIAIIKLVRFPNAAGLESKGRNLYLQTEASGFAMDEVEERSSILQGFLESSNVQVVEEMVKMITAQRAYEISSKVIQTSDDMLGMANNLKR